MGLVLYMKNESPAVRAVLMTAKALDVKLKHVELNLALKEHLTPEFIKLNPQHTIPTLVEEDGRVIWDSHAISVYLVEKYGKDDSLFPKDPYKRALVNQRLHFDSGVMFAHCKSICMPIIKKINNTIPNDEIEAVIEAYAFMETFLQDSPWISGENVTVADFHLISTVTSLNVLIPIASSIFPNTSGWLERAKSLPYYDANQEGLNNFRELMEALMDD